MKTYQERMDCWRHTQYLSQNSQYDESIKYYFDDEFNFEKKYQYTPYQVLDDDVLDCNIRMIQSGYDPAVLCFSDGIAPGGSIDCGTRSQEENIFRRTNYYKTLKEKYYPISNNECVYSPNVIIYKSSEKYNWDMLHNLYMTHLIACPIMKSPKLTTGYNDLKMFNKNDEKIFLDKIRLVFQVAYNNNHDSLILGAFSCDAIKGPIEHVAQLFKQVMNEYDGMFKLIAYTIPINEPEYSVRRHNYLTGMNEIFSDIFNKR